MNLKMDHHSLKCRGQFSPGLLCVPELSCNALPIQRDGLKLCNNKTVSMFYSLLESAKDPGCIDVFKSRLKKTIYLDYRFASRNSFNGFVNAPFF